MIKCDKKCTIPLILIFCVCIMKSRKKNGSNKEKRIMAGGEKYSVLEVANWFLNKERMDQKKLQKLCYFAYSWYLYYFNDIENGITNRLFKNDIQGWVHGPVSYELYRGFPFKGMELLTPAKGYGSVPETDTLTVDILNDVYETYKKYTGNQLEAMTHMEDPWIESRSGLNPYEPGKKVLRDETIFNYFSKLASE